MDAGRAGNTVIRSRAVDDSGNIETPSAGVSVTVQASGASSSIWNDSFTPANLDPSDHQAVELGVKFRSDVAGFVTGIRFYKGPANTGTHVGHLWTSGGSPSRHRDLHPASPHLAGSRPPSPRRSRSPRTRPTSRPTSRRLASTRSTANYFASAFDNAPLHALADGTDGPNGVYLYGGGFPTDELQQDQLLGRHRLLDLRRDRHDASVGRLGRSLQRRARRRRHVQRDGDLQRAARRLDRDVLHVRRCRVRAEPSRRPSPGMPGRSRRPSIRPLRSRSTRPTRRR